MDAAAVVARLRQTGSARDRAGMVRFGINVDGALGVGITALRRLARAGRAREFEKRAGFALMASAAVKDGTASDDRFLAYLAVIGREATDPRNFVRKGVNWALRQIGKRNRRLHRAAVASARRIARVDDRTARWVAADAVRELTDPRTIGRLS